MDGNATVFILDDDPVARASLCAAVEAMGLSSKSYRSAAAFLQEYDESTPGCVISDYPMAGMNGMDLQTHLLGARCRIPVIIVTAHGNIPVTVRALRNGAVTLLEKPCGNQELWSAINEALSRDATTRNRLNRMRHFESRLSLLTLVEREVMDLVVAGETNKAIADLKDVSIRTVEARRRSVFQKMAAKSVSQLVRLVLEGTQAQVTFESGFAAH